MKRQRAQNLVEFAVVAPIFFAMVFGFIDLGRGVWNYNTLASLTRDGARYAEVPASSRTTSNITSHVCSRVQSMLLASEANCVPAAISPTDPDANKAYVTVTRGICGDFANPAIVTVTYGFQPLLAGVWGGNSAVLRLQNTSQMYVESSAPGVCPT
jgi:Flp pilus assembly protein TadG